MQLWLNHMERLFPDYKEEMLKVLADPTAEVYISGEQGLGKTLLTRPALCKVAQEGTPRSPHTKCFVTSAKRSDFSTEYFNELVMYLWAGGEAEVREYLRRLHSQEQNRPTYRSEPLDRRGQNV